MTSPAPVKFFKRAMAQVFSLSVSPRFGSLSRMVSTVHNARKATRVPEAGSFPVVFGFRSSLSGVHASRTLIAPDLATLLDAVPKNTVRDEYAHLSIQENVPGKRTTSNRNLSVKYLVDLYSLDPNVAIFGLLRFNKVPNPRGVAVSKMMSLQAFLYGGEVFDDNVGIVAPHNQSHIEAIWCFIQSGEYAKEIRKIDQKLNITAATLVKIPFDLARWQLFAAEKYPNDLPEPESNDPTQWLFNGRLVNPTVPLQVGVVPLLGYRWPRQIGKNYVRCSASAGQCLGRGRHGLYRVSAGENSSRRTGTRSFGGEEESQRC